MSDGKTYNDSFTIRYTNSTPEDRETTLFALGSDNPNRAIPLPVGAFIEELNSPFSPDTPIDCIYIPENNSILLASKQGGDLAFSFYYLDDGTFSNVAVFDAGESNVQARTNCNPVVDALDENNLKFTNMTLGMYGVTTTQVYTLIVSRALGGDEDKTLAPVVGILTIALPLTSFSVRPTMVYVRLYDKLVSLNYGATFITELGFVDNVRTFFVDGGGVRPVTTTNVNPTLGATPSQFKYVPVYEFFIVVFGNTGKFVVAEYNTTTNSVNVNFLSGTTGFSTKDVSFVPDINQELVQTNAGVNGVGGGSLYTTVQFNIGGVTTLRIMKYDNEAYEQGQNANFNLVDTITYDGNDGFPFNTIFVLKYYSPQRQFVFIPIFPSTLVGFAIWSVESNDFVFSSNDPSLITGATSFYDENIAGFNADNSHFFTIAINGRNKIYNIDLTSENFDYNFNENNGTSSYPERPNLTLPTWNASNLINIGAFTQIQSFVQLVQSGVSSNVLFYSTGGTAIANGVEIAETNNRTYAEVENSQIGQMLEVQSISIQLRQGITDNQKIDQLLQPIRFKHTDSTGREVEYAKVPTIDPFQTQFRVPTMKTGMEAGNYILDGNTELDYKIINNTSVDVTFNFSKLPNLLYDRNEGLQDLVVRQTELENYNKEDPENIINLEVEPSQKPTEISLNIPELNLEDSEILTENPTISNINRNRKRRNNMKKKKKKLIIIDN